jgi:hypothetical protein
MIEEQRPGLQFIVAAFVRQHLSVDPQPRVFAKSQGGALSKADAQAGGGTGRDQVAHEQGSLHFQRPPDPAAFGECLPAQALHVPDALALRQDGARPCHCRKPGHHHTTPWQPGRERDRDSHVGSSVERTSTTMPCPARLLPVIYIAAKGGDAASMGRAAASWGWG